MKSTVHARAGWLLPLARLRSARGDQSRSFSELNLGITKSNIPWEKRETSEMLESRAKETNREEGRREKRQKKELGHFHEEGAQLTA